MCRPFQSVGFKSVDVEVNIACGFSAACVVWPQGVVSHCRVGTARGRASGMGACGPWGGRRTGRCHHERFLGTKAGSTRVVELRIYLRRFFAQYENEGCSVAHKYTTVFV